MLAYTALVSELAAGEIKKDVTKFSDLILLDLTLVLIGIYLSNAELAYVEK